MIKKFTTKLLLVSLISGSVAFANTQNQNVSKKNEVITQKDIQEQDKMVKPIIPSASDKIDDWANKFLQRMGIPGFGEYQGKFFYFAKEQVPVSVNDPQFGEALATTYEEAFFDVMEQYAIDMYGRRTVEQIKNLFVNGSTDAREIKFPQTYANSPGFWEKILMILDKSLDVMDKKLDKKLIAMGVDPRALKKMTPKQKKDVFKRSFLQNIITKASGDVTGLFTVQSAWASDKNGNYVVGVIAVVSPKTRQIAKDIRLQRKTLIRGRGRDIYSLIPNSPKDLVKIVGTRLAYDKDGLPVIISFGLNSYVPQKNQYMNVTLEQNAVENAKANADAQIAMLVNGYLNTKTTMKTGHEIEDYVERALKPDADTLEKVVQNVINITNKNAKATASIHLQGITTAKTWKYTLPTGQKMVGAVRVWKYSTLDKINKFKQGYRNPNVHKEKINNIKGGFGESKVINDLNDF